jgi:hypothetical protein
MLRLTSASLRGLAHKLESGPARSIAISAAAGTVGLAAGKLEDAKKTPLIAVAAGAGLTLLGMNTLGDGAMSGGAAIIGYRFGARMSRKAERRAEVIPGAPTVRRRRHA